MTTDNQQTGLSRADRLASRFSPTAEAPVVEAPQSSAAAAPTAAPAAERPARVTAPTRTRTPQRPRGPGKWDEENSRFQVWLSHDVQDRIRVAVKEEGVSLSRAVTDALEEWMAKRASSTSASGKKE